MHAIIALAAMDVGKHVYVQKPLCWSVQEARHLAQKAKTTKVVTQMGNQGHSRDEARTGLRVHHRPARSARCARSTSGRTGRSATGRRAFRARRRCRRDQAAAAGTARASRRGSPRRSAPATRCPKELDWDLFLGVAPQVDYHPIYHPFNWRGWVDWGQGALGDMGAHLIDHPFWSLDLGFPTVIETISTPFNGVCYPNATTTYYEFPARGNDAGR